MRVALISEDTYPYVRRGAATWCHQLLHGLDRHTFHLVALISAATVPEPAYTVPSNVSTVSAYPINGRPVRHRNRPAATAAAVILCRGFLSEETEMFADGLRRLADLAIGGHPLHGVPLADVLLDAWQAGRRPDSPRMSVRDARSAAELIEYALRPLAVRLPPVDLCHPVAAGLPLLVALAAKWRSGTPFLLSEHGTYLRQVEGSPSVRAVLLRFYRALTRLGYAEAALIAPVSRFNQRWDLRHGADPARVVVVPGGVEPLRYPVLPNEPLVPTVVWVGSMVPRKDLHTLIRAFRRVRDAVPHAGLRLVGPQDDPGYVASCRRLVERLRLDGVVRFDDPVQSSRQAFAAGHLVALSSVAEDMPYPLVEAMMCGRATVSTDVGAVSEVVGDTGLLVPPGDPVALAGACVDLLADPARRRRLGAAARARALRLYTVDTVRRAYTHLYREVTAA
ncbi:GT4 family glycosyltransferase PelF [Phytohabitans aurantiacus]|uniref:Lipopolysaccharide glycosyltransferase, putative n=1 Tax=Phytohabitans aurantiacus TaxID=3016789 RepID=A0ABQ5QPI4_9ACTN|nr:GT4 family glycosyltransferase PelF [Phytohabitans aurantiacus]GLH96154.1 lipopolysaccharide glycosyltransferase, putative [Phytohabitans aurantiacus]